MFSNMTIVRESGELLSRWSDTPGGNTTTGHVVGPPSPHFAISGVRFAERFHPSNNRAAVHLLSFAWAGSGSLNGFPKPAWARISLSPQSKVGTVSYV